MSGWFGGWLGGLVAGWFGGLVTFGGLGGWLVFSFTPIT